MNQEISRSAVITKPAKEFIELHQALCGALERFESASSPNERDRASLSGSIIALLNFVDAEAARIGGYDEKAVVLFELNNIFESYSGQQERHLVGAAGGLRKTLVDLLALKQFYVLVPKAGLARLPTGITSFYDHWNEKIRQNEPEYGCLVKDCAVLLELEPAAITHEAKAFLIRQLGDLLIRLDNTAAASQRTLLKYRKDIETRANKITGEVLLNFQILRLFKKSIAELGLDEEAVARAIRYWSRLDDFLRYIFEEWGWHVVRDYRRRPSAREAQCFRADKLYKVWESDQISLGVGKSFLAEINERNGKDGAMWRGFHRPIPIMIIGHAGAGKSSFFTALNYSVSQRQEHGLKVFSSGAALKQHYEDHQAAWRASEKIQTQDYAEVDFWRHENITGFLSHDYPGEESQPFANGKTGNDELPDVKKFSGFSAEFQKRCQEARGLIFMIDDSDLADREVLLGRAEWFRTVLDYWSRANDGDASHLPIALVVNKCDKIFGENLAHLERPYLIDAGVCPALIHHRPLSADFDAAPDQPLARLKDYIKSDPHNNCRPELQNFVDHLLKSMDNFFSHVLKLTYRYQIFLAAARPPFEANGRHPELPWGVYQVVDWMTKILETQYVAESLPLLQQDRELLEKTRHRIYSCQARLENLHSHLEQCAGARDRLNGRIQRHTWLRFFYKGKLKELGKQIADTEKYVKETAAQYSPELAEMNQEQALRKLVQDIQLAEERLKKLVARFELYEKYRQAAAAEKLAAFEERPPDAPPVIEEAENPPAALPEISAKREKRTRLGGLVLNTLLPGAVPLLNKSIPNGAGWLLLTAAVWALGIFLIDFPWLGFVPHAAGGLQTFWGNTED